MANELKIQLQNSGLALQARLVGETGSLIQVKNRRLARAISEAGWREFRSMNEAKSVRYGRETRVISRWEPTSQYCSNCGYPWGKLDLSVRELVCLGCGKPQDRDGNAAANIENVGVGRTHDAKRTGRACKTGIPAVLDEPSILPGIA